MILVIEGVLVLLGLQFAGKGPIEALSQLVSGMLEPDISQ